MSSINVDLNFWEEYPQYSIINPFKDMKAADKSKGKKQSSRIMWFVKLCYCRTSMFSKLPNEEKHSLIGEDFMEDKEFYTKNKALLDVLIERFVYYALTPMQRHMKTLEDLLNSRSKFLEDKEYNLDNFEALDKMVVGADKVYASVKKINEDMAKEDTMGSAKGDKELSITDKGLI